mmetsp:Transcript_19281/g.31558  ORF Transcript_19281/g.31558 Transcript_19281/m.31558 type:complete len:550 (+) Transcript_19281:126-1775(+)
MCVSAVPRVRMRQLGLSLQPQSRGRIRHHICFVCDFFYPNYGGIENHIYYLSQSLIRRGHKVVVVTHTYPGHEGIHYLKDGLKVYYLWRWNMYRGSVCPAIFPFLPVFREILLRESITIVHGHQSYSAMAHEAILHARVMGYHVCFTDHSLAGFRDMASIHVNKSLEFTLTAIDHVICVSNTSKENTVLRSRINPLDVSVIPNAIDSSVFTPDPSRRDPNFVTIVVMSRLVYRKGIDLLAEVIPLVCDRLPNVRFLIGGDGPKRETLEEMIALHQLCNRVQLLGAVPHDKVRDVLVRGDIFVNTSLTEAFCMAVVEAASCGLLVVSSNVGGVHEVLPPHMLHLAAPVAKDMSAAIVKAVELVSQGSIVPLNFHREVARMYSWRDVAERTERVYDFVMPLSVPPLFDLLRRQYARGPWSGKCFCAVVILVYLFWCLLDWLLPVTPLPSTVPEPESVLNSNSIILNAVNPNNINSPPSLPSSPPPRSSSLLLCRTTSDTRHVRRKTNTMKSITKENQSPLDLHMHLPPLRTKGPVSDPLKRTPCSPRSCGP